MKINDQTKKNFCLLCLMFFGVVLILVSILMLWSIPPKQSLLWVNSSDFSEIRQVESKGLIKGLNFELDRENCFFIGSNDQGFAELISAYHQGVNFRLGYSKVKSMFSLDSKLYAQIYDIQVNGYQIKLYENFVAQTKKTFGALGIVGMLLLIFLYKSYRTE